MKILKPVVIGIVCVFLISAVALGYYFFREITGNYTIPALKGVTFYADAALTEELVDPIYYGESAPNGDSFWVVNTGDVTVNLSHIDTNIIITPAPQVSLAPGESQEYQMYPIQGEVGTLVDFSIVFEEP